MAVRALKDVHGLSLAQIGRRFMMATDSQIHRWAEEARPLVSASGETAQDYIRRIRARSAASVKGPPVPPSLRMAAAHAEAPDAWDDIHLPEACAQAPDPEVVDAEELANIERLILELEEELDAPATRPAQGTVWTRFSVTPDIELSVRGVLTPREQALFEKLADRLRAILVGSTRDE